MRIRTKLILAIAVPVGLLVTQIVVVNVFIRELQLAVTFISSAHKVIEADFVATELVATMRAEVKQLPARYVTEGGTDSDETPLGQDWEKLTAEIDLIALDGRTLCFVEVRLRSSDHFGSPEESVDRRKRRQLVRGARRILARGDLPRFEDVRFDVVGVDLSSGTPRIRLTRDAFHLGDL